MAAADIDALDRDAPLAGLRDRFVLPEGLIYLDGNSLGPAPREVAGDLAGVVTQEWSNDLIASWNKAHWFELPQTLGTRLAPLIGAAGDEVLVCDGVSVNLYKCLHAALALRPERHVVVAEQAGFPTDLYILDGLGAQRTDLSLRLEGRDGDRLEDLIDEQVAVVLVNHVDYKTAALRDMAALTARAHEAGAIVVWDLCHSAGVIPVELDACEADFAVGCTYKYLNGGPGSPGFIYVARRHHEHLRQPLTGWWGHAEPFAFDSDYRPAPGIKAMLTGTQPILSMRALVAALAACDRVDMAQVRAKSMALTDLFITLVDEHCDGLGLELASPRDAALRGSHVSFAHEGGFAVMQALIACGVVGDFRAPDLLRFGLAPLYIRYRDVADAVEALRDILVSQSWRDPAFSGRSGVT
ncbi:MAG: kynureninase [Rhodospirillaceae bacterium]|nr:kynureninase [Rhodospirillaceae bacterium]